MRREDTKTKDKISCNQRTSCNVKNRLGFRRHCVVHRRRRWRCRSCSLCLVAEARIYDSVLPGSFNPPRSFFWKKFPFQSVLDVYVVWNTKKINVSMTTQWSGLLHCVKTRLGCWHCTFCVRRWRGRSCRCLCAARICHVLPRTIGLEMTNDSNDSNDKWHWISDDVSMTTLSVTWSSGKSPALGQVNAAARPHTWNQVMVELEQKPDREKSGWVTLDDRVNDT